MGITITVTDAALPASAAFIRFIYSTIKNKPHHTLEWFFQEGESLSQQPLTVEEMNEMAKAVATDPKGTQYLLRAYSLFRELLIGEVHNIRAFSKFRFFFVVGIPRSGGTYLTKQLFRATETDYKAAPNSLAHDGLPHITNAVFAPGANFRTNGLLQFTEYLTMVEAFFGGQKKLPSGEILVPKKFTKAIYNFNLVKEVFGGNAEYLITLRHPLSVCKSIMEKSGGEPEGRKFAVRSNIETWALEDWVQWGKAKEKVLEMDYVDCILGYWKRYHMQMAMGGMPAMETAKIVPYGAEHMTGAVEELYSRFGIDLEPESFKKSSPPAFTAEDEKKATKVVEEVASLWKSLGMEFPTEALAAKF